jgi:hypothetical protein
MTINEIRELENLNPIGERGDAQFVPMNLATIESLVQTAEEKEAAALTGENLQQQALNGAQVSSLLEIVQNLAAGVMTPSGAKAVLASAFPTMTPALMDQIVSGTVSGAAIPGTSSAQRPQQT